MVKLLYLIHDAATQTWVVKKDTTEAIDMYFATITILGLPWRRCEMWIDCGNWCTIYARSKTSEIKNARLNLASWVLLEVRPSEMGNGANGESWNGWIQNQWSWNESNDVDLHKSLLGSREHIAHSGAHSHAGVHALVHSLLAFKCTYALWQSSDDGKSRQNDNGTTSIDNHADSQIITKMNLSLRKG